MINTSIGNIGHLFVIISFVSSLLAGLGYWIASNLQGKASELVHHESWKRFARVAFVVHGVAVLGVIASLFYIIYNHLFEYHYAWSHSSKSLPVYYMISCFWEGQEGSFLLWIFWHVVLGMVLIATNKFWESSVMTVFALVQAFLTSMILGLVIFNLKLGSDPFILLRDAMPDIPVFQAGSASYNANYVPEDGRGLNPLLQNYWMVIHPPTLFLGFATTLIPFAFCIAGLWQGKYSEWIRPALPWALFSGAVLGLGILMGGYWAYETLNFGGYWNWDPVENAVYVPWLVLVASIHTMIAFKKSSSALKSAMILVIATFILILYATFLTRSGILGNASVHSFTDLGLSGQLLVYLLAFTLGSIAVLIWRWKQIPTTQKDLSVYTREFWIFMGAIVLCLAAFQVLLSTSIPVYNNIAQAIGFKGNVAIPDDELTGHYTRIQLWAAVLVALLSGTGQFFWWKKIDKASLQNAMMLPLILTLLFSALWIALSEMRNFAFIVLLTASIYSITANSFILFSLLKKSSYKLSGGAIAHIGIAMMLLGILFSSGYSDVISLNTTGFDLFSGTEVPVEENAKNIRLIRNEPIPMQGYAVTYKGNYLESNQLPMYIEQNKVMLTNNPFKAVAFEDLSSNGKTYFKRGDTLSINPENIYYKIEFRDKQGRIFETFPRVQFNPTMGTVASPDIKRYLTKDLYLHINGMYPDPEKERKWSEPEEHVVALGDTFFIKDYVAVFESRKPINQAEVMRLTFASNGSQNDIGIQANVRILGKNQNFVVSPIFVIKNNEAGLLPDIAEDLGLRITLQKIDTETGKFTFAVSSTPKDYVIMKAIEKPLINVLWIGTLVLMLGFTMAIVRRNSEFVKMRDKGLE